MTTQNKTIQKNTATLSYNKASNIIIQNINTELQKQGRKLFLDDDIKKMYRLFTMYFTNNREFEKFNFEAKNKTIPFDLRKGLLILGNTGRSKTFLFKIFSEFTKEYSPGKQFRTINSIEIQSVFSAVGLEALKKYMYYRYDNYSEELRRIHTKDEIQNLYIDELGFEEPNIKHYGTNIRPLENVLFDRHKIFVKYGIKTHASSNLQVHEFKQHYSQRIYSRIFEMFNIITTEGQDLRLL